MNIDTDLSGIKSEPGQQEAKKLVEEALAKVNPQYVKLFDKIGGAISIERFIRGGGGEGTLGLSRFPRDIAVKTSELSGHVLDRILTEEIIHFLDYHLRFSEKEVFNMQKAANADAAHPLSIGMLTAVRGGTKGLTDIEDLFKDSDAMLKMDEFRKELPFLGVYSDNKNMNKHEWLAEVEHAEKTLQRIENPEQANLLSGRAQQNMLMVLILRFLANHGLDLMKETKNIENGKKSKEKIQHDILEIIHKRNFDQWVNSLANKVMVNNFPAGNVRLDNLAKIKLAIAGNLVMNSDYPLSESSLQKVMITMFPESYYALKSFRDEVDRELTKLDQTEGVEKALFLARDQQELRAHLAKSDMDSVALKDLQSRLQRTNPAEASAIAATLRIYELIKSHKTDESEPTVQVEQLLRDAWPDILIEGKTITNYAAQKDLYGVAIAIRDASNKTSQNIERLP